MKALVSWILITAILCSNMGPSSGGKFEECTAANAADGEWQVATTKRENGVAVFCPKTFLEIDSMYQGSYICTGRTGAYKHASFNQATCSVMKTEESFDILKKHVIFFVGDSIMMQRWYALKCIIEGHKETSNVQVETKFLYSRFLRKTMACKHKSSQAGDDCSNDWLTVINEEIRSLHEPTISIVVGIGSWFDGMSKIAHHKDYEEIVKEYAVILGGFVKKGIAVLWIDLPPMVFDSSDKFWNQHKMFADKNKIAKLHMDKNGVQYFDTQKAITSRRTQDPTVFADGPGGMHACNPGKNSLPIFLVKRILHILAISKRDSIILAPLRAPDSINSIQENTTTSVVEAFLKSSHPQRGKKSHKNIT